MTHWLDSADMDLPRHMNLAGLLGDHADRPLWVHGVDSPGGVHTVAVWNTPYKGELGLTAYMGTDASGDWKPVGLWTGHPVVSLPVQLAIRLAWPSSFRVFVDGALVFDGHKLRGTFHNLFAHVRRLTTVPNAARLWSTVEDEVVNASTRLAAKEIAVGNIEAVGRKRTPRKKAGQ